MKNMGKILGLTLLFTMLLAVISPIASPTAAQPQAQKLRYEEILGEKYLIQNDNITVIIWAGGRHPIFAWWPTKLNDTIHVIHFKGLIEYEDENNDNAFQWKEIVTPTPKPGETMGPLTGPPKLPENMQGEWDEYKRNRDWRKILREEKWYPPFFNFFGYSKWSFSDFENITDDAGNIIGVRFTFTLQDITSRHLKEAYGGLIDKLQLRCHLHIVPIEIEVVKDGKVYSYTISSAELKVDVIIPGAGWPWRSDKSMLALWLEMYALNKPELEAARLNWEDLCTSEKADPEMRECSQMFRFYGKEKMKKVINSKHVDITDVGDINISVNATAEGRDEEGISYKLKYEEREQKRYLQGIKLHLATETAGAFGLTETKSLAGYFKFVNIAHITYPNGAVNTVDVTCSYLAEEGFLKIFLCYPNFGKGTLEHDPELGVSLPGPKPLLEQAIVGVPIWLWLTVGGVTAILASLAYLVRIKKLPPPSMHHK